MKSLDQTSRLSTLLFSNEILSHWIYLRHKPQFLFSGIFCRLTCSYFHLQSTKFPPLLSILVIIVKFTGYKTVIKTEIFLERRKKLLCFLSTYGHVTNSHTVQTSTRFSWYSGMIRSKKDFIVSSFPLIISLTDITVIIAPGEGQLSASPSIRVSAVCCCLQGIKITISVQRGGDRQVSSGYNWYK